MKAAKNRPLHSDAGIHTYQSMCHTLAGIQEQIRFADAKVGFIITLNAILFALVGKGLEGIKMPLAEAGFLPVLLGAYTVATVLSITGAVTAVRSRLDFQGPKTHLFFGHIAALYPGDHERYLADVQNLSEQDLLGEIANLIVTSSQIALRKHQLIMRSVTYTLITVLLWACVLLTMLFPHHWI